MNKPPDYETFIGVFNTDEILCDRLIDCYETSNMKTFDANRGYHRVNYKHMDTVLITDYLAEIQRCLDSYNEKYMFSKFKTAAPSSKFNIQKYEPGKHYKNWHPEQGDIVENKPIRHFVFMTYLNDVYNGGETSFFYQKRKFMPRKGKTLIWPSWWTHIHRGEPAPDEVKYIATGWITQDELLPQE